MNGKKIVLSLGAVLLILASAIASSGSFGNQQKPPISKMAKAIAPPHINYVLTHHDDQYCREYELVGAGFGAAQGNMRVLIDGVPCTKYLRWSSTSISVEGPFMRWNKQYSFVIDDGVKALSDVYKTRFRCLMEGPTPNTGYPGDIIMIRAWGVGPDYSNMTLKMGATSMVATYWLDTENPTIKVRVPAIAENNIYSIYLYYGTEQISMPITFRLR
jgi:hypothetical protein